MEQPIKWLTSHMLSVKHLPFHFHDFLLQFSKIQELFSSLSKMFSSVLQTRGKKFQKPVAWKPDMSFTESCTLCLIPPKPICFLGEREVSFSTLTTDKMLLMKAVLISTSSSPLYPGSTDFQPQVDQMCRFPFLLHLNKPTRLCTFAPQPLIWVEQLMITSGRAVRVLESASARAPMGKLLVYQEAEKIPPLPIC